MSHPNLLVVSDVPIEKVITEGTQKFLQLLAEIKDPHRLALVIATINAELQLSGFEIPEETVKQLRSLIAQKMLETT